MGHSADGFGLAQITWASQIGLEARPAQAGSPRPKQGSSLPMARRRRPAKSGHNRRRGGRGRRLGHDSEVAPKFWGSGMKEAHQMAPPRWRASVE
jgi:hypothetical protein